MKILNKNKLMIASLLALTLNSMPVLADRDDEHGRGNGKGHGNKHDREDRRDDYRGDDRRSERYDNDRNGLSINLFFNDSHRNEARDYYGRETHSGHCPPGLAKKGNGCMPPGQAKKWQRGHALPRDLTRYPVPYDLMRRLPPPPRGHEYVRVAGDILLIAVGTGIVVDAIEDLMR